MKKIDVHVHTHEYDGAQIKKIVGGKPDDYATPVELKAMYEKLGVDKAVLLPELFPECGYSMVSNETIQEIAEKYHDMFFWFCNIDPRAGGNSPDTDLSHFILYYKKLGAKGIGEVVPNLYMDDPLVDNLFYHAAACDMPVTIHIAPQKYECYGLIDDLGLPRMEKMLKKHPKLKLFGHSQPFWAEISTNVTEENRNDYPEGKVVPGRLYELFQNYENLYGDLSAGSAYNALTRDEEFGYRFIEEFQDRLLYGTDICSPTNDMPLSFWLDRAFESGNISEQAYRKVCHENAIRILKLDAPLEG